MKNKAVIIFISISILISVFFHLFKFGQVPPCLNADEAAIGYNAYSVMETGRDEYGELFPIRFKSFGEYKMPFYIYASIPFIKLFGLNDLSVRLLNIVLGISFILLIYLLTNEIFNNKKIAIISSFLISLTPWTYILTRHAHEAVSGSFLMLISWLFLVRYEKKGKFWDLLLTNLFIFISASAYNATKTFLPFFLFYQIYLILKKI
jgi:4-amino-4-deoxy-L-arabinose transferase-like glycosyltransferase